MANIRPIIPTTTVPALLIIVVARLFLFSLIVLAISSIFVSIVSSLVSNCLYLSAQRSTCASKFVFSNLVVSIFKSLMPNPFTGLSTAVIGSSFSALAFGLEDLFLWRLLSTILPCSHSSCW